MLRVVDAVELLDKNIQLCSIKLAHARWQMLRVDTKPADAVRLLAYANTLYLEQSHLLEVRAHVAATPQHVCGTA